MRWKAFGAGLAAMGLALGASAKPAALPAEISVAEAHRALADGDIVLIDVRRPSEWQSTGVAPGAALATLQDEDFMAQVDAITGGDTAQPVAFICRSGGRSARARDRLIEAGYASVTSVAGGMLGETGWVSAELPVDAMQTDCPDGITAEC